MREFLFQLFDQENEPMPIVLIDQDSDPNATIVEVSFGDRLGALIDTVSFAVPLSYSFWKFTNCVTRFHVSHSPYAFYEVNLTLYCTMQMLNNLLILDIGFGLIIEFIQSRNPFTISTL